MEDLTFLIPIQVRARENQQCLVTCPACSLSHTVPSSTVNRFADKELDILCDCNNTFYVVFLLPKGDRIEGMKIIVTHLKRNHKYKNVSLLGLKQNHLSFSCKDSHHIMKGEKLKVSITGKTASSNIESIAIVTMTRGKYIHCCLLTQGSFFKKSSMV